MLPIWNVGTGIANYDTLQSWLPLYWFGENGQAQVNYALSVGKPPVYSNGGKTVTISLNPQYKWSNGTPVTTRDIQFYINVLTASDKEYPQNWIGYSASGFPFNVTSIEYESADEVQHHVQQGVQPILAVVQRAQPDLPVPHLRMGQDLSVGSGR